MISKDTRRYYEVKFIIRPLVALFKPMLILGGFEHYRRTLLVSRLQIPFAHTYYIDTDDNFVREQCKYLLKDIYTNGFKNHKHELEFVDDREDAEVVIDVHDSYDPDYSLEFEFNGEWKSRRYGRLPRPPQSITR